MELPKLKKEMEHLMEDLPEDANWNDVMYRIYVRQSIESGLKDSKEGKLVDHKSVKEKFLK